MVLPTALHRRAISWYHHYLQHPGATCLEETLSAEMYWTGMRSTIRKYVKNCHKIQINKWHNHKYGRLPTKLVIQNPWEALCVDLIEPYTCKGKDKTEIDFMCITIIDPANSWFKFAKHYIHGVLVYCWLLWCGVGCIVAPTLCVGHPGVSLIVDRAVS